MAARAALCARMMTRREAVKRTALTAAAATGWVGRFSLQAQAPAGGAAPATPFDLPPLPYPFDALEPYIDAQTMQIHHDKHHAAYVANLNKAVAGQTALAGKSIEELLRNPSGVPEAIRTAVRNNGGGHFNHSLFWQMMAKHDGPQTPKGELQAALVRKFGSFDAFKQQFADAALKVFGSGWAWLTLDGKDLRIESTPNQDTPLSQGRIPLLGVDVWEHAYYLRYQNRRADYVTAFFNIVHWDWVADRYAKHSA
jgi:superoxide dismutase, Fe-Mn family